MLWSSAHVHSAILVTPFAYQQKKRKTAADAAVDLPSYAGLRASLPEAACIHDSTFMQVSMSALLLAMSNRDMNKSLLGSKQHYSGHRSGQLTSQHDGARESVSQAQKEACF